MYTLQKIRKFQKQIIRCAIQHKEKNMNITSLRLLRLREVMHVVGLKKSTIYNMIKQGTFPKPIKISSRAVAWLEDTIMTWINMRKEMWL